MVRPTEFAGIDRACTEFLRVLARVGALAAEIGDQECWGLGESDPRLLSAPALVARLRAKADGPGNSVGAVLASHARLVDDLRRSHGTALDRLAHVDEEWGARLRAVEPPAGQTHSPVLAMVR
ncbi:hypothetical protein [Nocardia sp. AG03]|uniref:hypothetical protein n=1 Tax=Nocardia sp. AG03 TaxID=3025312 RepID=UPI0024184BAF|nr:hypothetical protein [Nocardia sp. AG03]